MHTARNNRDMQKKMTDKIAKGIKVGASLASNFARAVFLQIMKKRQREEQSNNSPS